MCSLFMLCFELGAMPAMPVAAPPSDVTDDATQTITHLYARNAALKAFTFDAHVAIVMHRFPWFRFHLEGHGSYAADGAYTIQFDHVPSWARGFDHFDLTALDPRTWTKAYSVAGVEHRGEQTVLSLHDRKKSKLAEMSATLDGDGVRDITWAYSYGGHVTLKVTPSPSTFILPAAEDAEIVMPVMVASAHAEFTNYHIVTDNAPPAASTPDVAQPVRALR